jgi:hypothetical protein
MFPQIQAGLIGELLGLFGVKEHELVRREYLELSREVARLTATEQEQE